MPNIIRGASRLRGLLLLFAAAVVLVAVGVIAGVGLRWQKFTAEEAHTAVMTTLQSENAESILVTGAIQVAVTTVSSNTRYLLPGMVTLDLGTTEATARVPGTVRYGIDVAQLDESRFRWDGSVLYLSIPEIRVVSVEPDLDSLELETRVGWARTHAGSGAQVTREAVGKITAALREQGERHVNEALQPRVNTARAMIDVVERALASAGIVATDVRIEVADGIVVEKPQG